MTALLKLVNWQGWAGIGLSLALSVLLAIQWGETRHWHKLSDGFEKNYHAEQIAHQQTEINYRRATEQARAEDAANKKRVEAEQTKINQESTDDFEKRLAAARATADSLRRELAASAGHPGSSGAAPVPGVPTPAGGPAQASGADGLSIDDRLTATEQAIQLDELIKWVQRQHAVDPNAGK